MKLTKRQIKQAKESIEFQNQKIRELNKELDCYELGMWIPKGWTKEQTIAQCLTQIRHHQDRIADLEALL